MTLLVTPAVYRDVYLKIMTMGKKAEEISKMDQEAAPLPENRYDEWRKTYGLILSHCESHCASLTTFRTWFMRILGVLEVAKASVSGTTGTRGIRAVA